MMIEVEFMDLLELLAPATLIYEHERRCENQAHRKRNEEVLGPVIERVRVSMAQQAARKPIAEQMDVSMRMDEAMGRPPAPDHGPEGGAAHNPADPRGDL